MNFNPIYRRLKCEQNRCLAKTQTVVEGRLTPPHAISISKVHTLTADSVIGSREVFTGEARYSGMVTFKAFILDGEGKGRALECNADFSGKIESELITSASVVDINARLLGVEVTAVSSGEIRVGALFEITAWALESKEIECLDCETEGVETKKGSVIRGERVAKERAEFALSNTFEDNSMVESLLVSHRALVLSAKAGVDCVRAEGVIVTEIIGVRADGLIAQKRVETEFSEEFSALGCSLGDTVSANAEVSCEQISEEGEGVILTFNYALSLSCEVYARSTAEVVLDCFSHNRELLVKSEEARFTAVKKGELLLEKIDGVIALKSDMPLVDSILASPTSIVTVTNSWCDSGEVTVEGIISGNIIYYSAESNSTNSLSVELPFSKTLTIEGAEKSDSAVVDAKVRSVAVKIRRGNEIEVKSEVLFSVLLSQEQSCSLVCSIEEGEAREDTEGVLRAHIVGNGEGLWEICKLFGASEEEVKKQNSSLSFPIKKGDLIKIFKVRQN